MNCHRCENEVTRGTAHHEVTGYEQPRAAGGTNYITLRKRTGRILCTPCMYLLKGGIADQESLFAEGV